MKQNGNKTLITAVSWLLFLSMPAFGGNSKGGGSLTFRVISSQTRYHSQGGTTFIYTSTVFAKTSDGRTVVFICDQKGDECPLFEAGKEYSAEQAGKEIYITMTFPDGQTMPVRFKEVADGPPTTAGH